MELDLIKPLKDAEGSGTRRLFTYQDMVEIGIIAVLNEIGINTRRIKFVLNVLRKDRPRRAFLAIREKKDDASNLNNLKDSDFEPESIAIHYQKDGEIGIGIQDSNIAIEIPGEKLAVSWKPIDDKAMIVLNLAQIKKKISKGTE